MVTFFPLCECAIGSYFCISWDSKSQLKKVKSKKTTFQVTGGQTINLTSIAAVRELYSQSLDKLHGSRGQEKSH